MKILLLGDSIRMGYGEFVREIRVEEGYVRLHLIEGMAIDEN